MAWGFWSASTVQTDRGRSPRRLTTTSSSAIYYQTPQQHTIAVNQCVQKEETFSASQQQQQLQQQQPVKSQASVCGSPCQSVCQSPTCQSPSCQSGATGKPCRFNQSSPFSSFLSFHFSHY